MHRLIRGCTPLQFDPSILLRSQIHPPITVIFEVVLLLFNALAIAALGILDKQLCAFADDASLLQARTHLPPLSILPARQGRSGVNAEPEDLGLVTPARLDRHQGRVDLKQNVVEGAAKVGAVDGGMATGFGVVDVLAFGAEQLDALLARVVARPERQQRVAVAQDARAPAKVGPLELVDHLGQPARRDDVPCVHQPVQVARRLFNRLAHVVVAVQVEHVRDQVQRVLVVVHFRVQAGQVESVGDVFLVDFAEVFIAAR